MFDEFKDKIIGILTSRLTVFTLVFCLLGGILIYRCFDLQIVQGEQYLEEFVLEIEKTRDITSTRAIFMTGTEMCLPITNWPIP